MTSTVLSLAIAIVGSIAALTGGPTASLAAAPGGPRRPAVARAEAAGDRCADGSLSADRDACRREAAAVQAERARGADVDVPDPATLERNARARCERLPDDLRADCLSRAAGHGSTDGSVEGGAILRETVKRELGGRPPVVPVEVR